LEIASAVVFSRPARGQSYGSERRMANGKIYVAAIPRALVASYSSVLSAAAEPKVAYKRVIAVIISECSIRWSITTSGSTQWKWGGGEELSNTLVCEGKVLCSVNHSVETNYRPEITRLLDGLICKLSRGAILHHPDISLNPAISTWSASSWLAVRKINSASITCPRLGCPPSPLSVR
jgi:hypothetical protein